MAAGWRGYVGLVREEDGGLNVAAAFDRAFVRDLGSPAAASAAVLAAAGFPPIQSLDDADWRGTPALTRRTRPLAVERVFLLGDSAGYVEPFTGEGMGWALESGLAVAPLALRAIEHWSPDLAGEWSSLHAHVVRRRQLVCRSLAVALRHPAPTRVVFEILRRAPAVAGLVLGRLNASPQFSHSS
jgi:2-polyprenyl-6-methoxyphenol hydroxylase-like FAD-dependent oxidoreductase